MSAVFDMIRLFAWAIAALILSAPAAAWSAHDLDHAGAAVAIDEHHHHDSSGAIEAHEHEDPADQQAERDVGHDHLLSLSIGVGALPAAAGYSPAAPLIEVAQASLQPPLPRSLTDPPPPRPPRFL